MLAGLGLLVLLGIGITISWFRFSANWKKQEELARFLKENRNALIEQDVPIHVHRSFNENNCSATNWEFCDLFLFPEGLILRGQKNEADFHDCIFLYNKTRRTRIPKCKMSGIYETPAIIEGGLSYEITLLETGFMSFAMLPIKFELFPGSKTIEILKENNYA